MADKTREDYLEGMDKKICAILDYYQEEFRITPCEIAGSLEFIKTEIIMDTIGDDGDDSECPDFPQAESPLIPPK